MAFKTCVSSRLVILSNWFKTIQYKYNNTILETNKPFIFYKTIKCLKITINYNEITSQY